MPTPLDVVLEDLEEEFHPHRYSGLLTVVLDDGDGLASTSLVLCLKEGAANAWRLPNFALDVKREVFVEAIRNLLTTASSLKPPLPGCSSAVGEDAADCPLEVVSLTSSGCSAGHVESLAVGRVWG